MNICLVSTGFKPEDGGGIGTYVYNLAKSLSNLNKVVVITNTNQNDCHDVIDGIDVYRFKYRYIPRLEKLLPGLFWSYFVSKKISLLDEEYNFDIIEFPNWEGVGYFYSLKSTKKPMVIRMHTPYFETFSIDNEGQKRSIRDSFICWIEKKACLNSHALVCSTKYHAVMMAKVYDINPDEISVIPLGIMLKALEKKQVTNDHKTLNILYVSRLEKRKGTINLINVIPELLNKYKNIKFIIIGSDRRHAEEGMTYHEYFLKYYNNYKENAQFLGHVSDEELHKYYCEADIFVVPSIYESFGLVFLEAMFYGLPVIGCVAGGVPEVIEKDVTGILIKPGDEGELISALSSLIENKSLRLKMGFEGMRRANEYFTSEIMSVNTLNNYQGIINKYG